VARHTGGAARVLAAFDLDGESRPDWGGPEWSDRVRTLLARLEVDSEIVALAGVRAAR
jgi:hypothetical protein